MFNYNRVLMKIHRIFILLTVLFISCLNGYGQHYPIEYYTDATMSVTVSYDIPTFSCKGEIHNNVTYVTINKIYKPIVKDFIIVTLCIYKVGGNDGLSVYPSLDTYISYCNGTKKSKLLYIGSPPMTPNEFVSRARGFKNVKDYEKKEIDLYFEGVPSGCGNISIIDPGGYINGVHCQMPTFNNLDWITNDYLEGAPYFGGNFNHTSYTETSIRAFAKTHNDGICGIYEGSVGNTYKLGCIKENGVYKFIYLGCKDYNCWWNEGDIKAVLRPTATSSLFKADWMMFKKEVNTDTYVTFLSAGMEVTINGQKESYIKMYPSSGNNNVASGGGNNNYYDPPFDARWTGTGFALNRGYIATNHHVIDGARNIKVYGVKGNFNVGYNAQVVLSDAHNDLAVLKINDSRFTSFGTIPYRVKTTMAEVGEEVFILGYPMTSTMGEEIKLTTGVISARSGFQGDLSLYQTTAPIQPGNSGGPLFDNSGNLIGIVNAKHRGAENVGYAIKSSYLSNLIQSGSMSGLLPQTNSISGQSLSGKVKSVKNFVFLIKCN